MGVVDTVTFERLQKDAKASVTAKLRVIKRGVDIIVSKKKKTSQKSLLVKEKIKTLLVARFEVLLEKKEWLNCQYRPLFYNSLEDLVATRDP